MFQDANSLECFFLKQPIHQFKIKFSIDGDEAWMAGPQTMMTVGDTVLVSNPMPMESFTSSSLNRTFDVLFFVGGYQHPPNVDAAKWFTGEIWPRVRERLPGVEPWTMTQSRRCRLRPRAFRVSAASGISGERKMTCEDAPPSTCSSSDGPQRGGAPTRPSRTAC